MSYSNSMHRLDSTSFTLVWYRLSFATTSYWSVFTVLLNYNDIVSGLLSFYNYFTFIRVVNVSFVTPSVCVLRGQF